MKPKDIKNCKRISIIGPCGSGKSTLAKKLGEFLDLPVFHLDCLNHKPNRQKEDKEVLAEKVIEITLTEKWIIEGNYKRTLKNRFELSDLIIFLNLSEKTCIESARSRHKKEERIGLPNYYEETDEGLELLISYHIKEMFPQLIKEYINPLINQYKEKVVELTTREQINDFLKKNEQ